MGATVIGVVSTEEKAETVRSLGAEHAVLSDGFRDAVKEIAPGGVDLVADPVGNPKEGDRFTDSLRCLNTFGTVLVLGFTAGEIPQVKVNRLLLNNVGVAGAWAGARIGGGRRIERMAGGAHPVGAHGWTRSSEICGSGRHRHGAHVHRSTHHASPRVADVHVLGPAILGTQYAGRKGRARARFILPIAGVWILTIPAAAALAICIGLVVRTFVG